jgi:hypothetical protein
MDIIDNKYLVVKTRKPEQITEVISDAEILGENQGVHLVSVNWELEEAQKLKQLRFKNVPSPIARDYNWPGVYQWNTNGILHRFSR